MPDDLRKRVDELEMLASFQERTLSQLDEAVQGLYAKLDALEAELKRLKAQQEAKDLPPLED